MGMDVYGKNPTDEVGEYFRNNVWFWRPLWGYCESLYEKCREIDGHSNSGAGLSARDAKGLALRLEQELESGRTAEYKAERDKVISELPLEPCVHCGGTGIRTDDVGMHLGMPTKELPEDEAVVLGRTHGWCNACSGQGETLQFASWYTFDVDNVRNFAAFLKASGGFEIW